MRAIDVWVDADGVPVRVRSMEDGPNGEWSEWRRLPKVPDARLVLPSCESTRPWANNDWIGRESWTPSRVVPLQIGFDVNGNPFDSYTWDSGETTEEPSGAIDGPITVLSLGDLNSISAHGDRDADTALGADFQVDLQWHEGATVTLITQDDWPVATRISAPSQVVAAWDEPEPFSMYESFLTVATDASFPELDAETLEDVLEPLWDGAEQTTVNLDGKPGDELTVLTQSDASEIVIGRNDAGQIVALVVKAGWVEWRSLALDGAPPPSVLDRESQLRACVAGDREADLTGRCLWDN